jgi:type II secretory pathway component PulF
MEDHIEWVKERMLEGMMEEDIMQALKSQGWDDIKIHEIIKEARKRYNTIKEKELEDTETAPEDDILDPDKIPKVDESVWS